MWLYKHEEFTLDDINNNYGFVYLIINLQNNKKYIGKKFFWSTKMLPPLKGKKRRRKVKRSSNWQNYWSSSKILKTEVNLIGKENFKREIISLHPNKAETNYHEIALQIKLNVLDSKLPNGDREFYNENINRRYYPSEKFGNHRLEISNLYDDINLLK